MPEAKPANMVACDAQLGFPRVIARGPAANAAPPRAFSDSELMARLTSGDADALAALYDRHAPAVFGLTRSVLHDSRLAEEATHDIFLRLWQRPEMYEPKRGPFIGWLLRVARNRAIDMLRKDHEQPFLPAPGMDEGQALDPITQLVDPDPDPADQATELLQKEDVRQALSRLTPDQRRLLELAYFQGLTQREIANTVGRPLGTVKTQIRTAMQRMASLLLTADPSLRDMHSRPFAEDSGTTNR
jgi:RNA polymerase sigma-70 factor (ECF subfamily)